VPPAAWPVLAEQEAECLRDAELNLESLLVGVPHEIVSAEGDTWTAFADVIKKKEIDLIVLRTHGRTGIKKTMLGSVAAQVLRHAKCPVLTIGPDARLKMPHPADLNRILYATDFSHQSLAGAPYAISLAEEHRSQLILLHCSEGDGDVGSLRHSLHQIIPYGTELRCAPDCIVERGPAAKKILEVAEGHGADLIVLGVHGLGEERDQLYGGAYDVVARAVCPVLTVRG
jgi:nucleotide-binding universal stress UspA family protein